MADGQLKNFMGQFWLLEEDGVITMGLNEEALNDFDSIESVQFPSEGEAYFEDEVCGQIETSDGEIELYVPKDASVLEVNSSVVDDPSLIMEDPLGEGWLIKFELSDDVEEDEDDEEDDEDDDDFDEDDDEDYDEDEKDR